MTKTEPPPKKYRVIGWREWVSLPDFGVKAIKAKADTGARTSALHATSIRFGEDASGVYVSFTVVADLNPRRVVRVRAPLIEKRHVRSSSGQATLRPVVRVNVGLGGETWPIEVTLVNRDPMGFRMLLGRQALRGHYLVHPGRSFLKSESKDQ